MIKQNKRAEAALFTSSVFWGLIGLIIFLIFISQGGTSVISSITDFLKTIPAYVYIIFAVVLIFMFMNRGSKRRRR